MTPRRKQILDYLRSCKEEKTHNQIAGQVGGSVFGVIECVRSLRRLGLITEGKMVGSAKTFKAVEQPTQEEIDR